MDALDSSVLVASLVDAEPNHKACAALFEKAGMCVYAHALVETFNTLSGGRSGHRLPAQQVAKLLQESIVPYVEVVNLSPKEILATMHEAQPRGVRGGAIYDYLHLVVARKARARRLYTLDVANFKSFHRAGDPEIVHP